MAAAQRTWHLERSSPVRADAEGLFVRARDLPDANVGDLVVVTGHEGGEERTGTIVATDERDTERFFRLSLHH